MGNRTSRLDPGGARADMKEQGDRSPVPVLPPAPGSWWPVGQEKLEQRVGTSTGRGGRTLFHPLTGLNPNFRTEELPG